MKFFRLDNAFDRELQIVHPSPARLEAMLYSCHHPSCATDNAAEWTRDNLVEFLNQYPDGIERYNPFTGRWPGYHLWMSVSADAGLPLPIAGVVTLRLADTEQVKQYAGNIGYNVFPPMRGHHFAERATRLLLPLASAHRMKSLWITCNPDNAASARTCERLGATLVNTVNIPPGNPLYEIGERQKCRYRLDVPAVGARARRK